MKAPVPPTPPRDFFARALLALSGSVFVLGFTFLAWPVPSQPLPVLSEPQQDTHPLHAHADIHVPDAFAAFAASMRRNQPVPLAPVPTPPPLPTPPTLLAIISDAAGPIALLRATNSTQIVELRVGSELDGWTLLHVSVTRLSLKHSGGTLATLALRKEHTEQP